MISVINLPSFTENYSYDKEPVLKIWDNAIDRIARDVARARERALREYMQKHGCTAEQMSYREELHGNVVKWYISHSSPIIDGRKVGPGEV